MERNKSKRRKRKEAEPEMLIARIESFRQSYFVSTFQTSQSVKGVDDEAITELVGRIERASPRHEKIVGEGISISLVCAHRYQEERISGATSFFGSLNLRSSERSALAYLPALPFWNLPSMLAVEASYVQLHFDRVQYGSGDLTSLFIGPIEAMNVVR